MRPRPCRPAPSLRQRLVLAGIVTLVLLALLARLRTRKDERPAVEVQPRWYAVPEPHEYALFAGAGLLAFAAWRRRRN